MQGEDSTKMAGEVLAASMSLTGPASSGRLVCAPGAMAFSFYRRPVFLQEHAMLHFVLLATKRPAFRPTVETLEDRSLPSTLGFAGSELMFNPQPEPPRDYVATSTVQVPGGDKMFNPQPEPPKDAEVIVLQR
jgi:hypothetical protein